MNSSSHRTKKMTIHRSHGNRWRAFSGLICLVVVTSLAAYGNVGF